MLKTVQITSVETTSFNSQLYKLAENNDARLHLKVHKTLDADELTQFSEFITQHKPFPYTKLSLKIDLATLKTEKFLQLMEQLNHPLVSEVAFVFAEEEIQRASHEIIDTLTINVAPKISYPLHIHKLNGEQGVVPSGLDLQELQNRVIANIQKRNQEPSESLDETVKTQRRPIDATDPLAKKIKLKALIKKKQLKNEQYAQYIPLEIQHVETIEQQLVQEHQEVVEVQANLELHEIQEYGGELLGFQEFTAPQFRNKVIAHTGSEHLTDSLYALLEQELFANLPQAIKYISPDAAEHLSENLPSLVALNKDNLPNGFILKQSKEGELVLDYDAHLENEQSNPFTPVELDIEHEPIYNIELKEDDVRQWINDEGLFKALCPNQPYRTPKQLINLWIKYDAEGVTSFFRELKTATQEQAHFTAFLLQNFLKQVPQWDHLYKNELFFSCLKRMNHYDSEKLRCLQTFLEKTGGSLHDLSKTVAAFEVFWTELNILCTEQKVSISGINSAKWSTPEGGNPVVYMERMLFILKNARSLNDQFKLLNGINLDNYGAYYASRYEGFKAVAAEMGLQYNVLKQNKQQFNKNLKLYRVELEQIAEPFAEAQGYQYYAGNARYQDEDYPNQYWLIDCSKELPQPLNLENLQSAGLAIPFDRKKFAPPYQFYFSKADGSMKLLFAEKPATPPKGDYYTTCFRFIGLQNTGITASSLIEQFNDFKSQFWEYADLKAELLATMFFVSHERFVENQVLKPIFNSLNRGAIHREVIHNALNLLVKLYKLDIKLNQVEGLMLFESISGMNSAEFEGLRISKVDCIKKLLTQLEQNKFATFKLFDFRAKKTSPKWPFLYALDTAEYLAKDPDIAATYHDDLLLFCGLINSISKEVYYHALITDTKKKESPHTQMVIKNMEKVQHHLHQAATQQKPNNLHYAIQVVINAKNFFTFADFLTVCDEISALSTFDSKKVDEILRQHKFTVGAELPELVTKDNADLKEMMISLIMQLDATKNKVEQSTQESFALNEDIETTSSAMHADLTSLSISELQVRLQKAWEESGTLLSIIGKLYLNNVLKTVKELAIKSAFGMPEAQGLLKVIAERIKDLSDFQECSDFAKANRICTEIEKIARLFKQILKNPSVVEHEQEFVALFSKVDFSKFDYETLYSMLSLLTAMPQRNYLPLIQTILTDLRFIGKKERVLELLNLLTALNNSYFPSEYLDAFSKLVMANPEEKNFNLIMAQMVNIFDKDNKDPILELIMTHSEISFKHISQILSFSEKIDKKRDKLSEFLIHLDKNQKLDSLLNELSEAKEEKQTRILEILSKSHALNRINNAKNKPVAYTQLATLLKDLSVEDLELLYTFYETTPVRAECLLNALKKPGRSKNFQTFLFEFEKAPFGERDLRQQFSVLEVERVINQSKDLLNDTFYPYHYRKQLMEAFLLVNELGEHTPAYYNKPAKDLTNAEIKSFFANLKAKKIPGLTPFENRLLALGLMREVMYRSTGEFPYSTQMIALLDGMMHQGDFISNIDTGQGKSLTDSMKAALLWLDSDRVDLTTSSLVDAKRDIANYGPFLKLLGVPYSEKPISSVSSIEDFQKDGINFSTFAQLSLFFAKAKVTGKELDTLETVVSLVSNESDYTILDDRVIYRFATADGTGVSYSQEWIYYAINEFVTRPEFIANDKATAGDDLGDLKDYLKIKAQELKKSGKIVNKFSDAQYLSWLESALMVNYVLKENDAYVIPDEFEKKIVNGTELRSKVVKVLLKDNKVSPDSTFGNGIQQLLYARLNKELGRTDFVIEPQNKTIISTNNKNLLDYYRAHKGFIWGSSGTVGSRVEIVEQYRKYGFDFSKVEPHQKNKVIFNKPIVTQNEQTQFTQLISSLTTETPNEHSAPSLVFCKDINSAIRLFKKLEKKNPKGFPIQLYTGLGKEENFIHNASKAGMITITTSALGRNTDIQYDKIQGLRVWHTFIDSIRGTGQKSGRTGRQGSVGEVNFVFNQQELNGKTIEEIQAEIDRFAAIERSVNEDLYNVLGYLLTQVDQQNEAQFTKGKTTFLRESWSEFSANTEAQFRENCRELAYDHDDFMQKTLASFNQMMKVALKTSVVEVDIDSIKKATVGAYPEKEKYKAHPKKVMLRDCTPPMSLAYHLVHLAEEVPEETKQEIKTEVKAHLTQLFAQLNKDTFVTENRNYLHYLATKPGTLAVIVETHKEFLTQYLQEHSQKLNFVQRWLGYEGKLNQITSNPHYLSMFHAFTHIPNQPVVELSVIQQAVNTLLDEYLETSWFISADRKTWAEALKAQVNQTDDLDALIRCLSQTQVEVAKLDIAANKTYILKPLHFFGHSRYQSTLNRALNLAASLGGKTEMDSLANELNPLVAAVTDNVPMADLTLDELKHKETSKKIDKRNASVLIESLENTLTIKSRELPSGMIGRKGFFNCAQEEAALQDKSNQENTMVIVS